MLTLIKNIFSSRPDFSKIKGYYFHSYYLFMRDPIKDDLTFCNVSGKLNYLYFCMRIFHCIFISENKKSKSQGCQQKINSFEGGLKYQNPKMYHLFLLRMNFCFYHYLIFFYTKKNKNL